MSSRTRLLLLVSGAFLLVLIGLGIALAVVDSEDSSTSGTTTPSVVVSTSAPEETSVTLGIICTSPRDATDTLVGAWIAGDAIAAARCADAAVVDELFETDGAGAQWMFQGCGVAGADLCQYSYEGGAVTFTVTGSDDAGWKVAAIEFIAD